MAAVLQAKKRAKVAMAARFMKHSRSGTVLETAKAGFRCTGFQRARLSFIRPAMRGGRAGFALHLTRCGAGLPDARALKSLSRGRACHSFAPRCGAAC